MKRTLIGMAVQGAFGSFGYWPRYSLEHVAVYLLPLRIAVRRP